jgi:hypothetical protein
MEGIQRCDHYIQSIMGSRAPVQTHLH